VTDHLLIENMRFPEASVIELRKQRYGVQRQATSRQMEHWRQVENDARREMQRYLDAHGVVTGAEELQVTWAVRVETLGFPYEQCEGQMTFEEFEGLVQRIPVTLNRPFDRLFGYYWDHEHPEDSTPVPLYPGS
jgi:hypothetical protein